MPKRLVTNVVHVPLYVIAVALLTIAAGPAVSVMIARANSAEQLRQYRADQAAQAAAAEQARAAESERTRRVFCALSSAQADAFQEATTPAGKASYQAWLDVYELAQCEPKRR